MSRVALLVGSAAVLLSCSGGSRPQPAPPSARAPELPPVTAPVPAPRPAGDPKVAPAGTVATISIGEPGTVFQALAAYATAGGIPAAGMGIQQGMAVSGMATDRPISALVLATGPSPQLVVAGGFADEERVRQFAQSAGLQIEINGKSFVMGPPDALAAGGAHASWLLAQPIQPGIHATISAPLVNQAIAMATASLPDAPLAGFDSVTQLTCDLGFTATEATLRLSIGAKAGTNLATFTQSLRGSEFRLVDTLAEPSAAMLAIGKLDLRLLMSLMRSWMGPVADSWSEMMAVSDGEVAMRLGLVAGAWEMVAVYGLRDRATAATAYEAAVKKLAKPVVSMHTRMVGRPRVKKVAGSWVHEIKSTLTADATEAERSALKKVWGAETTRTLVGVFGQHGVSVVARDGEKAVARLATRLKKASKKPDARVTAAIAEAKKERESAIMLIDAAAMITWVMPKVMPAAPPSQPARIGLGANGDALAVRFVFPAEQLKAMSALMPGMP